MKLFYTILVFFISSSVIAQTNYALQLNGINQYVSIGAPITTNSSYTKEAWIYSTNNSSYRNIISSNSHPFWISSGTLMAGQAGSYTQVADPTPIPLNSWVHVAVTYDAPTTTMRLYRDGNLVSTNASTPNYTSENVFIGSHAGTSSYFEGSIDEVKIWSVALTGAQIKQNAYRWPADNAAGLVAYYKCNENSGTTLLNTTSGINGTIHNGTGWTTSPVQFSKNALSFDGTDDYIRIPGHNSLDIASAITLEGWIYATKNTGIQNVLAKSSNSPNTGYIFPRTDDGWANIAFYLHIGSWRLLSAPFPSLNAWHHVAATYDGSQMRIYINGNLAASRAQTGAITVNANALTLGNQPGYPEYFGGSADELRVWNVARTQPEIQQSMNRELDPTMQTGLVSYYNFNIGVPSGTNNGISTAYDQAGANNGTFNNFALSGASSNFIAQTNLITLPVRWLSFSAELQNPDVLLSWSTASEDNTNVFIVQHSIDASTWTPIGTLRAAGNSQSRSDYTFLHNNPAYGTNYYRILQLDLDGRSSYSQVRRISQNLNAGAMSVRQSHGSLHITLENAQTISLHHSDGRLIWRKQLPGGTSTINVTSQPKGVYILRGENARQKIVL